MMARAKSSERWLPDSFTGMVEYGGSLTRQFIPGPIRRFIRRRRREGGRRIRIGGTPGGRLTCNFNSLEPQNPQKAQKMLFPLRLVIRRRPDPPCSILLRKLEGETVASRLYDTSFVWFASFDAKKLPLRLFQLSGRWACL